MKDSLRLTLVPHGVPSGILAAAQRAAVAISASISSSVSFGSNAVSLPMVSKSRSTCRFCIASRSRAAIASSRRSRRTGPGRRARRAAER